MSSNSEVSEEDDQIDRVKIKLKTVYGLRTDVIGNIHWTLHQELIYPVEGFVVIHDAVTNYQQYMSFPERSNPRILQISHTKRCIACVEENPYKGINIGIFDLRSFKRRKTIYIPKDYYVKRIIQIVFSFDSRYLFVLIQAEEYLVLMLPLARSDLFIEGYPSCPGFHGAVTCIASNPDNHSEIAVGAEYFFIIMMREPRSDTLTTQVLLRTDFCVVTMKYLYSSCQLIGTDNNELISIVNGKVKNRQKAHRAEFVDTLLTQSQLNHEIKLKVPPSECMLPDKTVRCLTVHSTGIAYALSNKAYVFEKVAYNKYERKTLLTVPNKFYEENLSHIRSLAIDSKKETIAVTCLHAQIYIGILVVPESLKTKYVNFEPLGAFLHIKEITCLALCTWKPIIITGGKDNTVRIWNYETSKVEVACKYDDEIRAVALNNVGYIGAIAFTAELRIVSIYVDDYLPVKKYHFPMCTAVKFANNGHLLAAAYGDTLSVVSTYYFDVMSHLKGHTGTVLGISWKADDRGIASCGNDGIICYWNPLTGQQIYRYQTREVYRSVCISNAEPVMIFGATDRGLVQVFKNKAKIRDIYVPQRKLALALVDIAMFRSDKILFVVNKNGELYNIHLPLDDTLGGVCFKFNLFVTRVNKILFSHDGTMLMAITRGATLAICEPTNVENRLTHVDEDLMKREDVIIPRKEVLKKKELIVFLEAKLRKAQKDYLYEITQCETSDTQHLNEVHQGYCRAIEELKNTNIELENRHNRELSQVNSQINQLKKEHKQEIREANDEYTDRLGMENQKFNKLRDALLKMRDEYGTKLKYAENTLLETVPAFEADFRKQMDERRMLLREMMKMIQDKKIEFFEFCRKTDEENHKNLIETQVQFVKELQRQKNFRHEAHQENDRQHEIFLRFIARKDLMERRIEVAKTLYHTYFDLTYKLTNKYDSLTKDYAERERAIDLKEFRITELADKNEVLEKFKYTLDQKVIELNKAIAPKDVQIGEKIKHLLEMEHERSGLMYSNEHLFLQLEELKTKDSSYLIELELEKHRFKSARQCLAQMSSDIHEVSKAVDSPRGMRNAVKGIIQQYSVDHVLKDFLSKEPSVKDFFQKNRVSIENVLRSHRNIQRSKDRKSLIIKFKKERKILKDEFRIVYEENRMLTQSAEELKTAIKLGKRIRETEKGFEIISDSDDEKQNKIDTKSKTKKVNEEDSKNENEIEIEMDTEADTETETGDKKLCGYKPGYIMVCESGNESLNEYENESEEESGSDTGEYTGIQYEEINYDVLNQNISEIDNEDEYVDYDNPKKKKSVRLVQI